MSSINDVVDSSSNSDNIPCTEKDSPYYNMDYDKLWPSQKEEHDRYVNGTISKINPIVQYNIAQNTRSRMEKYKRNFIKKTHESYEIARTIILNG